ncbi:MAG TPA: hypothetical protein VGF59_19615 [Bryobacteraceae bacterium]|jgi:hypothetical protein
MAEQLYKLTPNRDLQCYFERPSAVAALSETSETGFTVSGSWRQQFDWAVVEWNRDNVFEHPALRNLPDGDLSGLRLSYEEVRTNCIPFDSILYPTVDWPNLRIWADTGGVETIYRIPLKQYAAPVDGEPIAATASFELKGTPTGLDYIELAWLDQHFNYRLLGTDTIESAISALADIITSNQATGRVTAAAAGNRITLTYLGAPGANGNRIGVYGTVFGASTESWEPRAALFGGGVSPQRWKVDLDFSNLRDESGKLAPVSSMQKVRKMRWTWSADLQAASFERSEFSVVVSNWTVTGTGREYKVAGPGSRRIEDDAPEIAYQGAWKEDRGNFSGGSIHSTTAAGASLRCSFTSASGQWLYLGTRRAPNCGSVSVEIDAQPAQSFSLSLAGEDVLVRLPLGQLAAGAHTLTLTHGPEAGSYFYFDFLELAIPTTELSTFEASPATTLATDWDTDHSIAIAPERTAWLIHKLGFEGRANHYAGALWFYELCRPGHRYASGSVAFSGTPEVGALTRVWLGPTVIEHRNLIGDTAETIAKCFEFLINAGSTGVWAQAEGAVLGVTARTMGADGNGLTLTAQTNSDSFTAQTSGPLSGGGDAAMSAGRAAALGTSGVWQTDLSATPRMNRAARDWSRSYFRTLKAYVIEIASAFSMELQHGEDSAAAGIAQRYPNGDAAWLNTPALQTNFGPASTAFWKQVYLDMAQVMAEAGVEPYLQFGEVQWWYFAAPSGMPFCDDFTKSTFQTAYGRQMAVIPSEKADPSSYPDECAHLPKLIGQFTQSVIAFVRSSRPETRFEVLYPPDVNDTPLNRIINFPAADWTPSALACLKTENFTYTGDRNLDKARTSIELPMLNGFPPAQSSHLVGIGDYTSPWAKELRLALGEGVESVVLFALDQFCLAGYDLPLSPGTGRAHYMG